MKNDVPAWYVPFVAALLIATAGSSAARAQCLPTWLYKIPMTISNVAGTSPLADHQVLLTVNTRTPISAGRMRPDGADIRFVTDEGSCTQASYWIESGINTASTRIWVKVPGVAAGASTTIYMFYGNNAARPASDACNVFLLFDNFDGNAVDEGKWMLSGPSTATVSNGAITFGTNSTSRIIRSNATFTPPVITETQVLQASGSWPNITQIKSGTWAGYGPILGGAFIRIGWTYQSGTNYSGSWGSNDRSGAITAGNVAGLWSFAWVSNNVQQFTWPGGSATTNYTAHSIGPVNVALGLLETTITPSAFTADWVRVRKYASPEPTVRMGAEEPARSGISIVQQPGNLATCEGTPATFIVQATGPGLTYQWRSNGADIPGATSPAYTIPVAAVAHEGIYTVVIRSASGSSTISSEATLTVHPMPVITRQPEHQTACRGFMVAFICEATGTDIHYQWRRNGRAIQNATYSVLSVPVDPSTVDVYDVVVSGACGIAAISRPVNLTISPSPVILEQPADQTVTLGESATFSVKVAGGQGETFGYQWQRQGRDIPGATASSYGIQSVTMEDLGDYNVVIKASTCDNQITVSNKASLIIGAQPGIISEPQPQITCMGQPASFVVSAAGEGLQYQWRKDGRPIPQATERRYSIARVAAEHIGNYDVVVRTHQGRTFTSRTVRLTTSAAPMVLQQPRSLAACKGTAVRLSIGLAATPAGFQWRHEGTPIPGATHESINITSVSEGDAGDYDVMIFDACGNSTVSAPATLTLNSRPDIIQQPASQWASIGQKVIFTVRATGTDLRYQWRQNGHDIPGATGPSCEVDIISEDNAGDFDVIITDACGNALGSATAFLSVSLSSVPFAEEITTGNASMTAAPNPAHGITHLRITLPQDISSGPETALLLFDALGRQVLDLSESFARNGYGSADIDVSPLPSGTYYCRLITREWKGTLGVIAVEK